MNPAAIACTPIGTVRGPVTEKSLGKWANVESEIHLLPEYAGGLKGLEAFSHVLVVFYLHQIERFQIERHLLRHPRGMEHLPAVGVFAQRTKFRPNPIGIMSVALRGIERNVLKVTGLDALDGTPVLDIKPYIPAFDRVENPRTPEWVAGFLEGYC